MSLINQMLRDLEQRKHADPAHSPSPQTLEVKPIRQARRSSYRPMLWAAVILSTGFIWWHWRPQAVPADEPAASTEPAPTRPATAAEPAPLPTAPQGETAVAEAGDAETTPTPAEPVSTSAVLASARPEPVAQQLPVPSTTQSPHATQANRAAKPRQTAAVPPVKPGRGQPEQPSRRAESLFRQAENSASNLMRMEYLREVLQLEPRHLAARQQLLSLLAREGDTPALEQFLRESLTLFPDQLIFITALAHFQVRQKDFAAAVNTLERIDHHNSHDTRYLGLLAAAYQQQQRCAQALPIYQKLSLLQAEKAENWLGLGICAEQQQQPGEAMRAYQQALSKNSLGPRVVDYIKQRLNALTR
ncbi:hypothetical protein NP590_13270 [Methylomonas sp. SURF-2]|uniref:Tetratricopeptide repeat protein n=1 Tax=Methylomonas subterranea TaxID=2952225 RepID=A0ABT1THZ3_9GAMM|nr:tetratricopeptide repeat protein [Methylomonas sp. SURF-2]MCQ8105080.1 hypothetical protein [Methylomonas sp. SURF-2]